MKFVLPCCSDCFVSKAIDDIDLFEYHITNEAIYGLMKLINRFRNWNIWYS